MSVENSPEAKEKIEYRLTDKKTFMVPVNDPKLEELPGTLNLDGKTFTKKSEHHITVITFPKGRELQRLLEANPQLEEKINHLLNEFNWSNVTIKDDVIRLEKDKKFYTMQGQRKIWHEVHAESLVKEAQLPAMAEFFQRLKDELGVDLDEMPPVHVTLYTHGDPIGIAVNTEEEFKNLNPRKIKL